MDGKNSGAGAEFPTRPHSGERSRDAVEEHKKPKMLQRWLGETSKEAPWSPLERSSSGSAGSF